MRLEFIFLILVAILGFLILGCRSREDPEEFLYKGRMVLLVPDTNQRKPAISPALFSSDPGATIRDEISHFFDRIPITNLVVREINVPWAGDSNLCRILIKEEETRTIVLYLSRSKKGDWRLRGGERWVQ